MVEVPGEGEELVIVEHYPRAAVGNVAGVGIDLVLDIPLMGIGRAGTSAQLGRRLQHRHLGQLVSLEAEFVRG